MFADKLSDADSALMSHFINKELMHVALDNEELCVNWVKHTRVPCMIFKPAFGDQPSSLKISCRINPISDKPDTGCDYCLQLFPNTEEHYLNKLLQLNGDTQCTS